MKKTAIVTGGARGIGLGISLALAGGGYDIAAVGMRSEEQCAEAMEKIRSAGGKASTYHVCDISLAEERARLLDEVLSRHSSINLLVNNAGIAPPKRADILEAEAQSFEKVIKTNLEAPYFLTQAVAREMIRQKKENPESDACVIMIGSVSAVFASTNRGDYCISKAGLAMACKLFAVRLAEFGIPVYEVRPGIISTDMTSGVKEKYDRMIESGLLLQKRWGTPEDIGRAVAGLAKGFLSYSTGIAITLDGGMGVERL